jgi:hypothetical protein
LNEADPIITAEPDNCIHVPQEHFERFEADIHAALRDLAGVSTSASYKLFRLREKLHAGLIMTPIFPDVIKLDFDDETDQIIDYCQVPGFFDKPIENPRYVHLDMALSDDRLGISCAFVRQFRERKSRDINTFQEVVESVPEVAVEWATTIEAVAGKQIPLYKIRLFLMQLSRKGYMIGRVSADLRMLSADTLQGLQKAGFDTEYVSVDKTPTPYYTLRTILYEGRGYLPNSPLLRKELAELEVSPDGTKIDHPLKGSKDMADAVCGAVYTASQNADRNKLIFFSPKKTYGDSKVVDMFWGKK